MKNLSSMLSLSALDARKGISKPVMAIEKSQELGEVAVNPKHQALYHARRSFHASRSSTLKKVARARRIFDGKSEDSYTVEGRRERTVRRKALERAKHEYAMRKSRANAGAAS